MTSSTTLLLEALARRPALVGALSLSACCYVAAGRAITRPAPFGPRWLAALVAPQPRVAAPPRHVRRRGRGRRAGAAAAAAAAALPAGAVQRRAAAVVSLQHAALPARRREHLRL